MKTMMVQLSKLMLDPSNPRLPASQQGKNQEDLAVVLEIGFDAITVAQSIAEHGFSLSEPLIVIQAPDLETYVVIEGNRRLTALLGLTRPDIRESFQSPEQWESLSQKNRVSSNTEILVVVAGSREDCAPIVGFRHICGILQWTPYAQARYIADLVNNSNKSFEEVHRIVGIDRRTVANLYREQAIVDQARRLGIGTGNLENSFSLLQVALGQTQLREFIGAPLGSQMDINKDPVPIEKESQLKELLGYIFGDDESPSVINDSRQIGQLGNVIGNNLGLAALRRGETLAAAKQIITEELQEPRSRLIMRLTTAKNALLAAGNDIPQFYGDPQIVEILDELDAAMKGLESPEV